MTCPWLTFTLNGRLILVKLYIELMMENQIEIYQSPDGIIFNVQLTNETFWLSQEQLTVLFEKEQSVISRHLINVFKEGELEKESNMQKMHIPNSDKPVSEYSLDVMISEV